MNRYFYKEGLEALKKWLFYLGVEDLKKNYREDRANRFHKMMNDYLYVMRTSSSDDDIAYIENLLKDIKITKKIQRWTPINTSDEKFWLCRLALAELNGKPNREKAIQLKGWIEAKEGYSRHIPSDLKGKYATLLKALNDMIA